MHLGNLTELAGVLGQHLLCRVAGTGGHNSSSISQWLLRMLMRSFDSWGKRNHLSHSNMARPCPRTQPRIQQILLMTALVWIFLRDLKINLPYNPAILLLEIYPDILKSAHKRVIYILLFVLAQFTVTWICNHLKCPLMDVNVAYKCGKRLNHKKGNKENTSFRNKIDATGNQA